MIVMGVTITDDIIRGLGRSYRKSYRAAMLDAVKFYHANIFPRHFNPSNRTRYKLEKRTPFYLQVLKKRDGQGQGRFVDLLLKGTARRRMLYNARIWATDGGNTVTLKMQAPRYFTNPFVGTYTDQNGEQKRITRQPNKVAEVVQVNSEDRANLAKRIQSLLTAKLKEKREKSTRKL